MDLPLKFTEMRDEVTVEQGGALNRVRKYVFYLGAFGPFTERVPLDRFDEQEIVRRVTAVRTHVEQIHR